MNPMRSAADEQPVVITRVAERHWHALADDRVVGRGEAVRRPDGRLFLSIDSWHGPVFDQLADAMLANLPTPLYTVVDEADHDLTSRWERAGFTTRRREWGYVVPTDQRTAPPPSDVTIVAFGAARVDRLRELDRVIRDEVEAGVGWQAMPAEVLPRQLDPVRYAVAAQADRYVGLVRLGPPVRQPRIGLIAVRADQHRRGIARALLAHALDSLHRRGIASAWAEIDESNGPALALFDGTGARRVGGNLELVLRGSRT